MRAWLKQSNKWYEKKQNINWNQNWKMNQGYMCLLYCLFVLFPFLWGGWRTGSLSEKKNEYKWVIFCHAVICESFLGRLQWL